MAHFVELNPSLTESVNRQLRRFVAGAPTRIGRVTASDVPSISRSIPVWVMPPELEASECSLGRFARETGRLHHQIGIGPNVEASATSASSGNKLVLESFSEPSSLTERISRAMGEAAQRYPSDDADFECSSCRRWASRRCGSMGRRCPMLPCSMCQAKPRSSVARRCRSSPSRCSRRR